MCPLTTLYIIRTFYFYLSVDRRCLDSTYSVGQNYAPVPRVTESTIQINSITSLDYVIIVSRHYRHSKSPYIFFYLAVAVV